jgi:hypothetical protein
VPDEEDLASATLAKDTHDLEIVNGDRFVDRL